MSAVGSSILQNLNVPRFTERALCAETDPELFFPPQGGSHVRALRVCRRCPAAAECLKWGVDNPEKYGIWGGLTPRQLRMVRRQVST